MPERPRLLRPTTGTRVTATSMLTVCISAPCDSVVKIRTTRNDDNCTILEEHTVRIDCRSTTATRNQRGIDEGRACVVFDVTGYVNQTIRIETEDSNGAATIIGEIDIVPITVITPFRNFAKGGGGGCGCGCE